METSLTYFANTTGSAGSMTSAPYVRAPFFSSNGRYTMNASANGRRIERIRAEALAEVAARAEADAAKKQKNRNKERRANACNIRGCAMRYEGPKVIQRDLRGSAENVANLAKTLMLLSLGSGGLTG